MPKRSPKASSARIEPRCKLCVHRERWRIELLKAGGASVDSLSTKFGVTRDSIYRHWANHVSSETKAGYLAGPSQLQELASKAAESGSSVIDQLNAVRVVLMGHLTAVTEAGDARGAAIVASKLVDTLTTIAKITGELSAIAANTINITQNNSVMLGESPAFLKMRAEMFRALAPFPEAREAVVAVLRGLDADLSAPKVIDHVR